MLDAVTYPQIEVITALNERLIPLQINTQEDAGKPIVERYRQVWTPDIRILGSDGFDYASWTGYLPPTEYLAQLLLAQAHAYLRMHDEPRAADAFSEVVRRFPTSDAAPQAEYYQAVAHYKTTHEPAALLGQQGWRRLRGRYPTNIWRIKQIWSEETES